MGSPPTARDHRLVGSRSGLRSRVGVAMVASCVAACAGGWATAGPGAGDAGREPSIGMSSVPHPVASADPGADASMDALVEADAPVEALAPDAPVEDSSHYPFRPFLDAADANVAGRFRTRLEKAGGIRRAIDCVCTCPRGAVENLVARNFLVERADSTYPALLDALRRAGEAPRSDDASACRVELEATVRDGVCFGYSIGRTWPVLDAHPLAVERRGRAQRALVKAIEGSGPRARLAMDVLLRAGNPADGVCTGGEDAIRTATPVLVKWLGTPRSPARISVFAKGAELAWQDALRALSFGGADRAIAEKPVTAFLADDATMPLAVVALARMGVDVTSEVPRLARILDGITADTLVPSSSLSDELTRLEDTLDALQAMGTPARAALPNVAALMLRTEVPGCRTLGARRYVELVRAIATPADARLAVVSLTPLLPCPGSGASVARALSELGATPLPSAPRDP
jgi:hypothetical protein